MAGCAIPIWRSGSGQLLHNGRDAAGLMQRELGDLVCVRQRCISNYEHGWRHSGQRRLSQLVEILGLELDPAQWPAPPPKKRRAASRWFGIACSLPGCKRPVDSLGRCTKHYKAEREARNLAAGRLCTVDGCGRP